MPRINIKEAVSYVCKRLEMASSYIYRNDLFTAYMFIDIL
jgi:hypothetical protein